MRRSIITDIADVHHDDGENGEAFVCMYVPHSDRDFVAIVHRQAIASAPTTPRNIQKTAPRSLATERQRSLCGKNLYMV